MVLRHNISTFLVLISVDAILMSSRLWLERSLLLQMTSGVWLNERLRSWTGRCRTDRATASSLQPLDKQSPTDDRLARVQPDAGRDANQHWAHVLEHKYLKDRSRLVTTSIRARDRKYSTHVTVPLDHPVVEEVVFVEKASEKTNGRQDKEAAEEADTQH